MTCVPIAPAARSVGIEGLQKLGWTSKTFCQVRTKIAKIANELVCGFEDATTLYWSLDGITTLGSK